MDGKEHNETDLFFQRFLDKPEFGEDLATIGQLIKKMGSERSGARLERFRFEDNASALPVTPNELRLYCIRCTSNTVILCGGGQKTSQKVQDSPDAYPHFSLAKRVETLFRERIDASRGDASIWYNGSFLDGDKIFDTDIR